MIGIYKITSPSGKIYIGQSIDIEKRFKTYSGLHCIGQPILYNSLKKHGLDNHIFEIILECNIKELNKHERDYQDKYNVLGKNGLNCKLTKDKDRTGVLSKETKLKLSRAKKGKKLSEEHKKKISLSRSKQIITKEHCENISKALKGKKLSEETKKKLKEINKGKKHTKKTCEKMSESKKKLILNTQTGIFYNGVKEVSDATCQNISTMMQRLNGNLINNTAFIYV